jgi:type VI secretion system secreted protein Hcp
MRTSVLPALALLLIAGCAGVQVKDCGADFNCFIEEMNKNCSPAKVQYVEIGINTSFESMGFAALESFRTLGGPCAVKIKINGMRRILGMDNTTWGKVSAALPLLRAAEMVCNITPQTAETLYSMQSVLLAAEVLDSCSGSLIDILRSQMGLSRNGTRGGFFVPMNLTIEPKPPNRTINATIPPLNLTLPLNLTVTPPVNNTTVNSTVKPPANNTTDKAAACDLSSAKMYMTVKGQSQGDIKGEVSARGHENTIQLLDIDRSIFSPTDYASGLPTGKRIHSPVTIAKKIDKASPQLMQALVNNENLEVKILVYGIENAGKEMHCYTIELMDAGVASLKQYMGFNETVGITGEHLEEISFTYQKIIWTYEQGGIISEDDWETPIV